MYGLFLSARERSEVPVIRCLAIGSVGGLAFWLITYDPLPGYAAYDWGWFWFCLAVGTLYGFTFGLILEIGQFVIRRRRST